MKTLASATFPGVALALMLSACASTTLDTTWRDPTYEGRPFSKVLVVGWTENAENRRIFEDVLVAELKSRGADAVASYTLIASERDLKRDAVVQAVKTSGADSVITTRLVGIDTKTTQTPVTQARAATMDLYSYSMFMEPQTTVRQDYQIANLESNLFDAKTSKMVWWGRSQAFPTENIRRLSREVGQSVIRSLKSAKLL
jgi:hypothetical protein